MRSNSLDVATFNGDLLNWRTFWEQFEISQFGTWLQGCLQCGKAGVSPKRSEGWSCQVSNQRTVSVWWPIWRGHCIDLCEVTLWQTTPDPPSSCSEAFKDGSSKEWIFMILFSNTYVLSRQWVKSPLDHSLPPRWNWSWINRRCLNGRRPVKSQPASHTTKNYSNSSISGPKQASETYYLTQEKEVVDLNTIR